MPKTTKGKFHMAPPASIDLIGSYPLGTCIKPNIKVDLAVTIPAVSHHLGSSVLSFVDCSLKELMFFMPSGGPPAHRLFKPEVSEEKGSLLSRACPASEVLPWYWDNALLLSPWKQASTCSAADSTGYLNLILWHTEQNVFTFYLYLAHCLEFLVSWFLNELGFLWLVI